MTTKTDLIKSEDLHQEAEKTASKLWAEYVKEPENTERAEKLKQASDRAKSRANRRYESAKAADSGFSR